MFDDVMNSLLGLKKSRYIAFATIFFALLSTFVESGIQQFLDERLDPPFARLVLAGILTVITSSALKILDALLARCRSGFYLYGLCLEAPEGPHYVVGYFEVKYDAEKNRHRVDTAVCFDCLNLCPGATLLNISRPRAKWTADKIWMTEDEVGIVYVLQKLEVVGPGRSSRGGTPDNYLGLMLLQARRGLTSGTQYQGQIKYVQDSHDHHGYVYCEKVRRRGATREEWIAMIESDLRDKKARDLVDAVARVRNEKRGAPVPQPRTGTAGPELMAE